MAYLAIYRRYCYLRVRLGPASAGVAPTNDDGTKRHRVDKYGSAMKS